MDRTNLERQRRWQARHMIKPTQSPEEIAERLRDVLDQEKLGQMAALLGAIGNGVNNDPETGQAPGRQAGSGVNNGSEARQTADNRVETDVNNASNAERIVQLEVENAKLREQLGNGQVEGSVNNAPDGGQSDTERTEDGVNNAPKTPDPETLRVISDLFRTFKPSQLRFICAAFMRRLKIKGNDALAVENAELRKQLNENKQKLREVNAEAADETLRLQNQSLRKKLKAAELSSRMAWKRVDELKSASAGTVIMTGAEHRAVVMCLHPDRATTAVDEIDLNVAMAWFNGLSVVKQQKAA